MIGLIFLLLVLLYTLCILAYIFFQRYFVFKPARLEADHLFKHEVSFKEFFFQSSDGTSIHALHILPESKKGIVIYFHGNMKHLEKYLRYTKKFTDFGWSVIMMDYRSYGKSAGILTETNFFEDAQLAYDHAKNFFTASQIIIYGRSLGTAAATWLAVHNNCRELILESPYYNMYDLAWHYGMPLPKGNYLKFGLRTDLLIGDVKSRIIILHGTSDRTVPLRSAKKLVKHLKPGDQLIEIKGAGHRNMEAFEKYHETMKWVLGAEQDQFPG